MHTIDLAYAGHGIHEELVAYVADQEGTTRTRAYTSPSAMACIGRWSACAAARPSASAGHCCRA